MKKVIILSFILVNTVFAAFSQDDKYTAAMTNTIDEMQKAKTVEEFTAVSAKFERIGDAEKTQWLPFYYAALIKVNAARNVSKSDVDKTCDDAKSSLDKAEALAKDNSEIFVIKAMIAYARMNVDPMNRWMQYGAEANAALDAGAKADATNPRIVSLKATSTFYTPEQFGGGCTPAKPLAEKALKMFAEFKPASTIHPNWGKEMVDMIIGKCK